MACLDIPRCDGLIGEVSQATTVEGAKLAPLTLNAVPGGQAGLFAGFSR